MIQLIWKFCCDFYKNDLENINWKNVMGNVEHILIRTQITILNQ